MSVVDWDAIANDPGVAEIAALLRERFGVWIGFIDADGVAIPTAESAGEAGKPVCRALMANSLEHADGSTTSCVGTVREWAEEAIGGERSECFDARCHAGMRAKVVPVRHQGECVGAAYASGFFGEGDEDDRDHLDGMLETNEFDEQLGEAAAASVATVDAAEMETLEEGLRRIGELAEERLTGEVVSVPSIGDEESVRFEGMIGATRRMRTLFEKVATVAETDSTVLVQGENGTGKELVARAIHRRSRRADRRFVAVNCAAIPDRLVESELFGHKKGSFSGAHRDREGLCTEADGGTLFLDEIGDMAPGLQSKLLRFLQDGEFTPVGSNKARQVDVRVVCATNQDLEEMVQTGEFRRDLYFRIRVVQLIVPPLRERRRDIPVLADYFLSRAAREHGREPPELTEECRRQLLAYEWPGNVRELENEIERLVIMAGDDEVVDVDSLSARMGGESSEDLGAFPVLGEMTLPEATEQLERRMILDELRSTGWNKTQTAENLDVSRRNLIRKVSYYGLEEYRDE